VARAYGARCGVDSNGVLVYAGAIDSTPSANVDDIQTATKPSAAPSRSRTGCAVKYPSQS